MDVVFVGAQTIPIYLRLRTITNTFWDHSSAIYCFVSDVEVLEKSEFNTTQVPNLKVFFLILIEAQRWNELLILGLDQATKWCWISEKKKCKARRISNHHFILQGQPENLRVMLRTQKTLSLTYWTALRIPFGNGKSRALSFLSPIAIFERMIFCILYQYYGVSIYFQSHR
jgi:long-chain acyl-CoA synthetase